LSLLTVGCGAAIPSPTVVLGWSPLTGNKGRQVSTAAQGPFGWDGREEPTVALGLPCLAANSTLETASVHAPACVDP
jgi:hypothetical protein